MFFIVAGAVISAFIVFFCFRIQAYRDVKAMLECDYSFARKYPDLPLDDRYIAKLGTLYTILDEVRNQTPENAVIYWPSAKAFMNGGLGQKFYVSHVAFKMVASRFLYPRKIVTEAEYRHQGAVPPLTHVFVVRGEGLELLPYDVPAGSDYMVFPMDSIH